MPETRRARPTRPFRIAVLSDLHLDREQAPASWELARAALRGALETKADHVVLAGDTFDCATAMHRDRDSLRRMLRRAGLWSRDRLSIVVGNHDLFHTPHHGTRTTRALEVARIALRDAQASYDAFCDWAGALVDTEDRLDPDDLFPFVKRLGHVRLVAADTTSRDTASSGNAFHSNDDATLLRALGRAPAGRTVVAMHHPPFQSRLNDVRKMLLRGEYEFGFPAAEFRRLRRTFAELRPDAVVCGHLHATDTFRWTVDDTRVFVMGRTGGLGDEAASIGLLDVPERGATKWSVRPIG